MIEGCLGFFINFRQAFAFSIFDPMVGILHILMHIIIFLNARQILYNLDLWLQNYVQYSLFVLNLGKSNNNKKLLIYLFIFLEFFFMDFLLNFDKNSST